MTLKNSLRFLLAAILLSSAAAPAFCSEAGWTTNFAQALQEAQKDDKAILLDFNGSDWCEFCMKTKIEVFNTPQFKQYARKNLVLVDVDFPHKTPQSAAIKAQNQQLTQKYQSSGIPCYILLDKNGHELTRQTGYAKGGPSAFIAMLSKAYHPAPKATDSAGGGDDFNSFFNKKPAQ